MRARFQADADLDGRILRGLRPAAFEFDIRTASDAGLAALGDPEVLRIAADEACTKLKNGSTDSCGYRFN